MLGMTSSTPPAPGAAVCGPTPPADRPVSAAGIRDRLARLEDELASVAGHLDPGLVTTRDAAELARHADRLVRRATALRMELAARAAEAGGVVGRSGRMVTPERWAAGEFGLPPGQAAKELHTAEKLRSAPETRDALRAGRLSIEQARQVADAVADAPGQERSLLDTAEHRPGELAGRCRDIRARAGGREGEEARRARHHRRRRLVRSEDEDLAATVTMVTSGLEGARFDALLQPWEQRAADRARAEGRDEPAAAIRHDALMDALEAAAAALDGRSPGAKATTLTSGGGFTRRWGGARAKVIVRVDHAVLVRGYALPGERLDVQVNGRRPVPISLGELREILDDDPMVAFVLHDGVEVQRVVHAGRPPTALQRTALEALHDRCADVDCRAYGHLEVDHLHDWTEGGRTTLDNLAPLCGATHDAKTHRGRRLHRIPGSHLVTAHPEAPAGIDAEADGQPTQADGGQPVARTSEDPPRGDGDRPSPPALLDPPAMVGAAPDTPTGEG